MDAQAPEVVTLQRRRARALEFGALALVGFGTLEAWIQGFAWAPLVVRAGWALAALAAAVGLRRGGGLWASRGLVLFGFLCPFFYAALLKFQGGPGGVAFASFMATPILAALLLPGDVPVAVAAAAANLLAGLGLLRSSGIAGRELAEWAVALSTAGLFAVFAARQQQRMMEAEHRANEARVAALDRAARAERQALLGQLAAGLAHEVNNPLSIITTNAGLLGATVRDLPPAAAQDAAEALTQIDAGVRRVADVVRELTLILPEGGEPRVVDALPIVRRVVEALRAAGSTIHDALPSSLPEIHVCPAQLERIVRHLLSANCLPGAPCPSSYWLRAEADAESVTVVIEDDGPELWTQTRSPGSTPPPAEGQRGPQSGLGFALIRESLRQWNGSAEVRPRPGGGARTVLRLPRGGV